MSKISESKQILQILPLWIHPKQTAATIKAYQDIRLQQLITHAYQNVPFYRDLFDQAGINPQSVKTAKDLQALPLVSKQDIKHQPEKRLLTRGVNPDRISTFYTSGATGKPFAVKRSKFENFLFHVMRMRAIHNYGLKPSDKFLRIRGDRFDELPLSWRAIQALGLYRQIMLGTSEPPESLANTIQSQQPDVLTGYSGALVRVAQILSAQSSMQNKAVKPRFVVGGADSLTPLGRKQIREAFKAPVYDNYESQEVGLIAWECQKYGHLHVCDDSVILEILHNGIPAQDGEEGEVVVTGLQSFTMPFIRFRLEDLAVRGTDTCPCGLPFSTLRHLQGKATQYFILPEGREVNPWFIDALIYKYAIWIEQYELVQERLDRIILRVLLPKQKWAGLEPLQQAVQAKLGYAVKFKIEPVTEIKPGPSGKFFYHRSCIAPSDSKRNRTAGDSG